jgi:hypothetical protein
MVSGGRLAIGLIRVLRLNQPCRFLGPYFLVFLLELVYASRGIDKLLLAGEEGVAVRADFDADIAFMSGTGLERVLARADHVDFVVGRVYSSFHSVPFEEIPS